MASNTVDHFLSLTAAHGAEALAAESAVASAHTPPPHARAAATPAAASVSASSSSSSSSRGLFRSGKVKEDPDEYVGFARRPVPRVVAEAVEDERDRGDVRTDRSASVRSAASTGSASSASAPSATATAAAAAPTPPRTWLDRVGALLRPVQGAGAGGTAATAAASSALGTGTALGLGTAAGGGGAAGTSTVVERFRSGGPTFVLCRTTEAAEGYWLCRVLAIVSPADGTYTHKQTECFSLL
jgi:hypothetical protein